MTKITGKENQSAKENASKRSDGDEETRARLIANVKAMKDRTKIFRLVVMTVVQRTNHQNEQNKMFDDFVEKHRTREIPDPTRADTIHQVKSRHCSIARFSTVANFENEMEKGQCDQTQSSISNRRHQRWMQGEMQCNSWPKQAQTPECFRTDWMIIIMQVQHRYDVMKRMDESYYCKIARQMQRLMMISATRSTNQLLAQLEYTITRRCEAPSTPSPHRITKGE